MPNSAEPHVWGAVLGACRIHHNMEMGEIAAKNLFPVRSQLRGVICTAITYLCHGEEMGQCG